jgi:ribosomal RNA-processing protein 36
MTGEVSAEKFRKNYDFLAESHQNELQILRDELNKAKRLLSSAPKISRTEHQREIDRLERAVKRAETSVHRDKKERIEQEAIQNAKREEFEKRKHGKGQWHMKRGNNLLLCLHVMLTPYR